MVVLRHANVNTQPLNRLQMPTSNPKSQVSTAKQMLNTKRGRVQPHSEVVDPKSSNHRGNRNRKRKIRKRNPSHNRRSSLIPKL